MPGRVKAVLLLLVLVTFPVFPQCSWTPKDSTPFRATAYDVSADAPYVWLATGYGIQLLENEGTRVVDALPLPGSTRVVRAAGNGLAYAGSGSRLYVLRRDGRDVNVLRFADAGATINDILITGSYLFVATSNGIAHFEAFDPADPHRTNVSLPTSQANVTSLATMNGKLFAADGDATVEVFSISTPSLPQHTGELEAMPRATAVHATADGTLYVSDAFGQNTDVFAGGTTHTGRLPAGANAFAAYSNKVHFAAGPDRTIRAIDFASAATLKEQYEHRLLPTSGTDNVIHAMARDGATLYVAAGDIGLVTMYLGTLGPPYPVVSYRTTATTSSVAARDLVYFADASGTITEQRVSTSGIALNTEHTWTGGTIVQDVDAPGLLTSSGNSATLWSFSSQTPVVTSTFAGPVKSAVLLGGAIVALLEDGTVWKGTQQIALPPIAQLARSGGRTLFVEVRDEGKTVLHTFTNADLTSPATYTLDGAATGRVALDATRAALFTFNGITIIDLTNGQQRVIEGSNAMIPLQLAFAGEDLLVLSADRRTLHVYEDARTLVREQFLPADAVSLSVQGNVAFLASSEGTMAALYLAQQPEPEIPFSSAFYTKVVTGGDRVYLVRADSIDIFTTQNTNAPRYLSGVRTSGIVDVAALADSFFTLSASGVVTAYSKYGAALAQMTINEGADAQMLAIDVAGNAVWVSLSKGCQSGGCQKKTLVLDPSSLAVTASLNGGVTDVVTSGTRAYALFDLPAEIRVINIADPLHPAQLVAANAPANATSIAATSGKVFVTAEKVYQYAENTLALTTTHLTPVTVDKAQQIRIDGSCMVITARTANPETYNAATMAPAQTYEVPANVRSIALQPGRLLLLTTHSLEVWSAATDQPQRRRTVR